MHHIKTSSPLCALVIFTINAIAAETSPIEVAADVTFSKETHLVRDEYEDHVYRHSSQVAKLSVFIGTPASKSDADLETREVTCKDYDATLLLTLNLNENGGTINVRLMNCIGREICDSGYTATMHFVEGDLSAFQKGERVKLTTDEACDAKFIQKYAQTLSSFLVCQTNAIAQRCHFAVSHDKYSCEAKGPTILTGTKDEMVLFGQEVSYQHKFYFSRLDANEDRP